MSPMYGPGSDISTGLDIPVPLFALDHSDGHLPARIYAISSESIQLRTKSHLSSGKRLVMHHEGRRKELEVVACRERKEGGYDLHCKVTRSEDGAVRDEWRMAVHWPVYVQIFPSKTRHKAQVRDVSVFGLGIQLPFQPELGALLIVQLKNGVVFGRVKHCRQTAFHTYTAGLYVEQFCSEEGGITAKSISQSLARWLRKIARSFTGTVAA